MHFRPIRIRFSFGVPAIALCVIVGCLNAGWIKSYPQTSCLSVQQTNDGGYVTSGGSVNLLKVDENGNEVWRREYGGSSKSIQQTTDGGYIVVGSKNGLWILKTDRYGDSLWTRTYGSYNGDEANCVTQTNDGGYAIIGKRWTNVLWLLKTDSLGDTIWTREYASYPSSPRDVGNCIKQTSDSGYVISGTTRHMNSPPLFWLLKTDSIGDTIWTRTFYDRAKESGLGPSYNFGYSVIEDNVGNYVACGASEQDYGATSNADPNLTIIKYNSKGDSLWAKALYAGSRWTHQGDLRPGLAFTTDDGYVVTGFKWMREEFPNQNIYYLWLIKINSLGDILWSRTYEQARNGFSVQQTSDGGFIVAGRYYGTGYLIKTDSLGLLEVKEEPVSDPLPSFELITPIGRTITLRVPEGSTPLNLVVFDASGRMVDEIQLAQSTSLTWGEGFSPGVYFIRESSGKTSLTCKVILVK